jgi:hypothetical protein
LAQDMSMTEKFLCAQGRVEICGRTLKRHHHIRSFGAEIEPGFGKAARDVLPELVPRPDDDTLPGGTLPEGKTGGTQ